MPIVKHSRKRVRNRIADQRRGSARDRGYTTEWDKFSKAWLTANPLCLYCETQGRVSAAELTDHIVPHGGDPDRFWPPDDVPDDRFFAACCKPCHDGPKQRAEAYAAMMGQDVRVVLIKRRMLPRGFFDASPITDGKGMDDGHTTAGDGE
jgi:5-methylcytosine-specific restriction protein A